MKKTIALALVAGLAAAASADVVAYWAFNDDNLPGGGFGHLAGSFPMGADNGAQAGSATVNVTGGLTGETTVSAGGDTVYTWIQSFIGSTVNAQFGAPAGGSLSVQGGTDVGNNGAIIEVAFNGALYESLNFSFAGRRTNTGFNNLTIAAFDGASFLGNIATGLNLTTNTALNLYSFDTSILDGVADARVFIILDGATNPTGNVRLDNFLVEGTLIPAPGALALVGLGGLVASRRRR